MWWKLVTGTNIAPAISNRIQNNASAGLADNCQKKYP
jgi:hypothetical protein